MLSSGRIGNYFATVTNPVTTQVRHKEDHFDRSALRAGIGGAFILVFAIYAGSRGLKHFDWELSAYAIGSVFALFAAIYRYALWSQRPPTRMYMKRGWHMLSRNWRHAPVLARRVADNFILQKFIGRRSRQRWLMHTCLSWGGMSAFALTFPLVFGWIHFETLPANAEVYRVFLFGFPVEEFSIHSIRGFLHFNLLNLSAVILVAGLALAFKLRATDAGEIAVQTFADDLLPLLLLFAVSVSGLLLTVSSILLAGYGFQLIAVTHAASVLALLFYLPFGKLSHIVQRPLSLAVGFYKDAGQKGLRAACLRCGNDYASQLHIDDLKTVLDQVGFNFRFASPARELHYQDICPQCRRRLFALNQGRAIGR
jgi:hypothetical protein